MRLRHDAKHDLIRATALFADCTPEEVKEVAAVADEFDFRAGKHLTTEDTSAHEFVVIIDGQADVMVHGERVNTMGAGDWFGEIGLVTGSRRTATVVARTDVHALVIAGPRFKQLLAHAPDVREKVERVLAERAG